MNCFAGNADSLVLVQTELVISQVRCFKKCSCGSAELLVSELARAVILIAERRRSLTDGSDLSGPDFVEIHSKQIVSGNRAR